MGKNDIMFFCALLESAERFAFVRTIDKITPILEISASPYYKKELEELLTFIRKTINFKILEVKDEA